MTRSVVTFTLAGLGLAHIDAGAGEPPAERSPEVLTVLVYEYAGLSLEEIGQMSAEAERVLNKAGVESVWHTCRMECVKWTEPAGCSSPAVGTKLRIRIVAGDSDGWRFLGAGALGFANVTQTGGNLATLFIDRISELASRNIASRDTILAHAAAHEIGHLLLASVDHSRIGIMQAQWGRKALGQMDQRALGFTCSESEQMRRNLTMRANSQ